MKKAISRRHFLRQLTAAGGAALLPASGSPAKTTASRLSPADLRRHAQHAEAYDDLIRQPVYNLSLTPHWLADHTRFWYCRDGPEGAREFLLVDAGRGQRRPAFDHEKLAAALTRASGQTCRAGALPLRDVEFTEDAGAVRFRVGETTWQCELTSYACTKLPDGALATGGEAGDRKEGGRGESADASGDGPASPDGRWVAFVKEHNVYVRGQDGVGTPLSHTGTAERTFSDPRWSPDSKTLVAFRGEPVVIPEVYMVESSPPEGFRGVLHHHEYAQPGDRFPGYEIWTFDPEAQTATQARVDVLDFGESPPHLHWAQDSRRFLYEKTDRGHQRFRLMEVDARTGAARTIIDETAATFINTSNSYLHHMAGTGEVLYISERDGWRHLYLYDAVAGRLKNQVTRGEWVVRDVGPVDEGKREIWFEASGKEKGQDPYLLHYYRVNFDGTGLIALTEGDGGHSVQYSPDRAYLIDTYSRADHPPAHTLRRASDGALICPLETADISALTARGWRPPEVFRAKGRDHKTDIWGLVFRPRHLDPAKKYPIIENIYAGPQDSFVRKTFAVRDSMQSLAELGFIVVMCDGMGTRNRSKAFHDVCWRNLKDAGLPDRIAWIKALARKYPCCDTSRVGIYGTSAGGQSSTGALLFHPEFYKVAVSSCGCHDNRVDKRWWNEQWMGCPVGPWYADSSNVVHAANLRGKLLLMVGELDTNVPPESTLRVADALIKAGKDFDLLVLPGQDHGGGGAYGERRRRDYFIRHLHGVEPPDRNAPRPPAKPVALTAHDAADEYLARADGGEGTTVRFENRTRHEVRLFWLPGDGGRRPYGTVAPGATHVQNTYAGHTWLVTDAPGRGLAIFIAEAKPGIAEIRQSGP